MSEIVRLGVIDKNGVYGPSPSRLCGRQLWNNGRLHSCRRMAAPHPSDGAVNRPKATFG